jgi:CBS domain containing-hemolysin-like protein
MSLFLTITTCLAASFILSGLESALLSFSPVRLHHLAKEGQPKALHLERLLARRQQLLVSILILNAAINLVAFALLTHLSVDSFGRWGYPAAFLVALPVYLVWIELLPKSLFKNFPCNALLRYLPLLSLINMTVRPLISGPLALLRLCWGNSSKRKGTPGSGARDEFRLLTDILEREGTFERGEKQMIHQVLDFQRLPVSKVMLPLSRVTAVPLDMPITSVLDLARETQFFQFPAISPQGDLIGLIDVAELLNGDVRSGVVRDYLRKWVHASPSDRAIDVLRQLRSAGLRVAVVHETKGHPLGIVAIDDMIPHLLQLSPQIPTVD